MSKSDKIMSLAKKFIPLLAGGIQFYYGEPNPGWASVKHYVDAGQAYTPNIAQSAIASLTGVRLGGIAGQATTKIDLIGVLNPLDFRNAPTPKVILLTRLALEGIDTAGKFMSSLLKDILK